jgi:hypothetical protein
MNPTDDQLQAALVKASPRAREACIRLLALPQDSSLLQWFCNEIESWETPWAET